MMETENYDEVKCPIDFKSVINENGNNKYTERTYRFLNKCLKQPISSKVLRLAAELNDCTPNEAAIALILSNKCGFYVDELQYFDGKWGDTPNAESNDLPF